MQGRIKADTPAPPKKPVLFDAPVGGGKPMLPERSPDFQTKNRNILSRKEGHAACLQGIRILGLDGHALSFLRLGNAPCAPHAACLRPHSRHVAQALWLSRAPTRRPPSRSCCPHGIGPHAPICWPEDPRSAGASR
jgi:hypothetical protein